MNNQTTLLVQNEREALLAQFPFHDSCMDTYSDTYTYVTCHASDTLYFCFHDPTDSSDGYFMHIY